MIPDLRNAHGERLDHAFRPGADGVRDIVVLGHGVTANKDRPFLAYLSFYSVHGPIQTTKGLWEKFRRKAVAQGAPDRRFVFDRRLPVRQVQDCPIYAGMIESMDNAVGIVLDKLDELGLSDNTIVVFTSDNGSLATRGGSNVPLRGTKGTTWEGGQRVPCIMRWPGKIPAGAVCRETAATIDVLPTIAGLIGVELPADRLSVTVYEEDDEAFATALRSGQITAPGGGADDQLSRI